VTDTALHVAGAPGSGRFRVFATPADEPRSRRASDLTRLLATGVGLAAISTAAVPSPSFVRAIENWIAAVPHFLDAVWQVGVDALALGAVVLLVAAIARRRYSVARDLVVAGLVTFAAWILVARVVTGSWPGEWDALRAVEPPPLFPALRVALPGALVLTASPHLVLPLRRLGGWSIALSAFGVAVLGAASPLGSIAGLLLALGAAAAVHLVFGSSAGWPGLDVVVGALGELGVEVRDLELAERQEAGLVVVRGRLPDGAPIDVKVYGRDAHDSAVLATLWRTVWYRDPGAPLRVGRLQQVEHEAFLTLLARQAGVRTDVVVTAAATSEDDVLLVLARTGRLLEPTDASEALVDELWRLVGALHRAGIAHGRVDQEHLFVEGATDLGIRDFRGSSAVATEGRRNTDRVQALVTSVTMIGPGRAVHLARHHLGDDVLATSLAFIQPALLTPSQQRAVEAGDVDLERLRHDVAEAIGAEVPALQELRRVSPGSIVRVVLPAIAVLALFSMITGLDVGELGDLLRDARWWLLLAAFPVAQIPRFTQAISTVGASPAPMPLGPVYRLQLAVSYISLAVPSAAGRIAVNIRFFQRHGLAPGTALAAGALDGVSSLVLQILILVVLVGFTSASLDLDLDRAVDSAGPILLFVVVLVAAMVLVVLLTARFRRFVFRWAARLLVEALHALKGLSSPRRLAMLLGGSLATELLFAASLGMFVAALGHSVGLGELLLTNISVSLLAGLMPVPGGIGVAEGGLTLGLVQAGLPEEAAFSAVLLYRMATFYLPPFWGYFSLRWLERNEHL
jgi:glycosyltransferase 2 family protein